MTITNDELRAIIADQSKENAVPLGRKTCIELARLVLELRERELDYLERLRYFEDGP